MKTGRRSVCFVVVSEETNRVYLQEMLQQIGGEVLTNRRTSEIYIEIKSTGNGSDDVHQLLEDVFDRVRLVEKSIHELANQRRCQTVLRITQQLSTFDAVGAGFSLSGSEIGFLSSIGAFLDVDLYVEGESTMDGE
jgi:hypothetical protein